ncbi:hypothetical protein [Sinorhizobium saheli]|jgi:hypothetical protein|uniref:Uncharacterized protein n=1 Tax=Sinorhizobium saheli TaxID=36856 RepID=A0A178YRX4_SINSA|nr:hypothetical protein [Sinorhizobium saheli]MQW88710.1 hypothetical protein [Sinorhizobium saheli]OAP50362.1 hypothetical protein ATB98_20160 [Sinorhizobium saheli]
MTWFRSVPALPLAALLASLSPEAGLAEGASLQLAQAYPELPGVRPLNPLQEGDDVVCEQVLIDRNAPFESSSGRPRYDTLYRCRKGNGPVFQGGTLPPSLERQKRGLNY